MKQGSFITSRKVTMAWSDLDATAKANVNDVLDSGWLSRHKYIPRFETQIAKIHGQKYGVMMNSGTDCLRVALATLKEVHKWPDGSEVLVPAVTFVASVNVIIQNNLKPVFVDVDRFTYNVDASLLTKFITTRSRAILPVHLMGLPCNMNVIMGVAKKHKLKVLEDSCETMFVHKIQGEMACFSTYMAHMIQTGVGGVLTTNNPVYERLARSYMNHGRDSDATKFRFERIGYSSRVTEMEAALGCAQLQRWEKILERRQVIAWELWSRLPSEPLLQMPIIAGHVSSWMLFPIVLLKGNRDKFMSYMLKRGIETRQMMPLINQAPYKSLVNEDDYPNAKWINENGVCLPCHQLITDKQVDYMVGCVKGFFK